MANLSREEEGLIGPIIQGSDDLEALDIYADGEAAIRGAEQMANEFGIAFIVYLPVALVRPRTVTEVVLLGSLGEEAEDRDLPAPEQPAETHASEEGKAQVKLDPYLRERTFVSPQDRSYTPFGAL